MTEKKSYGPFVRIATPERHIYRTTLTDVRRWFFGVAGVGGVAFFGYLAYQDWRGGHSSSLAMECFLVLFSSWAASLLVLIGTRLEIDAQKTILWKKK